MGSLMDTFLQNPLGNPLANKPVLEWFPSFGPTQFAVAGAFGRTGPVGLPGPRPGLARRLRRRRPAHLPGTDPHPDSSRPPGT